MDVTVTPLLSLLVVWLLSVVISRPLHLDFSLTRRLGAGLVAFLAAQPIITAVAPPDVFGRGGADDLFPGFWYLLLGTLLAVVLAMVLLVLAEVLAPSGSLPGPVRILRAIPAWLRRTARYLRISRILLRHGLGAYVFTRQRPDTGSSAGRRRLARSVVAALEDAGVSFVKLGQILSTRPDLLSVEFVQELSRLRSDAAPVPWPQIRDVLAGELGRDPGEVFAELDEQPLAAASIAQVHAARLPDGREVVVKVQRPRIVAVVESDLDIVERLARRLERSTRWGRSLGVTALAAGFAESLREELDFRVEARNIAQVAAARGRDGVVRTPRVEADLVTRRVLVMERFAGVPVDARPVSDPAGLAHALLDDLLGQILVDGVFHADPHPGNILLLDGLPLAVGLIDLGSVGRLDAALRASLRGLLLALDRDDPVAVVDALLEMVDSPAELDERGLQRAMGRFLVRSLGPGATLDAATIGELFAVITRHGLTAPPELAAVLRSIGTLEGTLTRIDPGFDVIAAARAFAGTQMAARLEPAAVRRALTDELAAILPIVRRLPRRVDRIVAALDSGSLTVRLASPAAPAWTGAVLSAVLVAVVAATTGVMATLLLGTAGGPVLAPSLSLYQLLGYLLLVVSAILGLRVLAQAYRRPG